MTDYMSLVERIATEVTAPLAADVDGGTFPTTTLSALGEAGLLGLVSATEVGGMGLGPRAAAQVVERLARECGSTAMVVCMHYCGTAVIEAHGSREVREAVAAGHHLSTLAFSEAGSRSHFWAPVSTARRADGAVQLDARKSWVTSANHATAYVWSSQPLEAEGASTLWLVRRDANGVQTASGFDGLGLRGNDSGPVTGETVRVTDADRLGPDGGGFDIMMGVVLPWFQVQNAACSVGLMEGALARACEHASGTRYQHLETALADLPTIRAYLAKARCKADAARALLDDTLTAMETGRADAQLRVLQSKAVCNDTAAEVMDTLMRVCGGAAFRKDVGVERSFRDARAGLVMAPTSDVLYDFIGKAICGMELF